jgi:hypothetical protein
MAIKVFRAVLDTNVVIAAIRSRNVNSPTVELIRRWLNAEFALLYSRTIYREYARKLNTLNADPQRAARFLEDVLNLGVRIAVRSEQIKPVTADPKDNVFVACALIGNATHLVTYDPHIRNLGSEYRGIQIVEALEFLYLVRGDQSPTP